MENDVEIGIILGFIGLYTGKGKGNGDYCISIALSYMWLSRKVQNLWLPLRRI